DTLVSARFSGLRTEASKHSHRARYHEECFAVCLPVRLPALACFSRASTERACVQDEAQVERKCVYKYDDKYKFRRIVQADCLVFDSHFESGNLNSACRVLRTTQNFTNQQEYDLLLQHDVHSYGHMQWFYFSVSNTIAGAEVQFNVTNFVKSDSMFNDG